MRNRYLTFLFLVFGNLTAWSQIQWQPLSSNPEIARAHFLEQEARSQQIQALTGRPMELPSSDILRGPCPSFDTETRYLFPGDTIGIFVDTTSLGGGPGSTLTVIECDPVDAGIVSLDTTSLVYIADMGIDSGIDTLCVEFCPADGDCLIFNYPVVVKRPGTSYTLPELEVQAGSFLSQYCLDETLLPGALTCNRLIDCGDTYAGDGQQIVYFDTYSSPTSCIRYQASEFAGIDEVCVVLCDEFTVCDTFRIPFRIASDTLDLPFFDDFSYAGPYPQTQYWLDRDVFVNNTMSTKLPSVGMATFDGLDRTGSTYNTEFGIADLLTSRYIDLSNTSGEVVLKFFVAPKGLGLYPNETDSLFVEFRNIAGEWDRVASFAGISDEIPLDSVPAFLFKAIPISEVGYLYDGFQFRFSNLVSPSGLFDLWHVDYVYLNDSEDQTSNFEDLAFGTLPGRILQNYSSMPWAHFEPFVATEFAGSVYESTFFNHFEQVVTVTESAITLEEDLSGFTFAGAENVVDGVDANIPPKVPVSRQKTINNLIRDGYIDDLGTQFPGEEYVRLALTYELTQNSQDPLFFRNDVVTSYTEFDNYFAYDDGSAESYLFLENPQGVNPSLAVKYHANVEDSLRAIQFHFPHVNGNVSNQLFNMRVYLDDLDTEPAFEAIFIKPVYPDIKFDTLQGFTTYRLQNLLGELTPVFLPENTDFYVVFQQATVINKGIPIGFDLNNQEQDNIFVNLGDDWVSLPEQASDFKGALMIRPVVGDFTPPNTAVKDIPENPELQISISPNPSDGFIQLSGLEAPEKWKYRLMDGTGSLIRSGTANWELNFTDLLSGWYILQLYHPENGQMTSKKLIITH
ncbi:MAG: T9SS type A sorting domain-containing protein [Saprospiraceae bacterium]|nr:T9SS type A sorting domain-containing protein [Saprospiraceae bacterium]